MSIEFKGSSSAFISTIVERLDTRKLTKGQELSVGIPTKSVSRLLDLFTTGRLLSFLTQLRNEFSIPTEFVFATPRSSQKRIIRDLEYLFSMDFLKICGELGISIKQPQTSQPLLGDELEESSYFSRGKIEKGIFRSCLIPLQLCPFDASVRGSEAATAKEVSRLVGIFTDSIDKRLFRVGYSGDQPNLELSRLLFVFLTEMISNSISHSGSSQLLIGMTLSREFGDEFSAHRHGISLEAGQPKFELLVMDWGQGIFNSFAETLNGETISPLGSEYFSLKKWQPEYRLFRTQEQSTLLNIFRGDLVIRKGRKSEGLHELGRSLQWFGGLLNLYTGRCELLISAAGSESPRTAHRNFASPFYLPGVIASVVLPSYELKVIAAKSAAITESVGDGSLERNQLCEIRRLRDLPKGFWGGSSAIRIQRRGEIDAELIVDEYLREVGGKRQSDGGSAIFWDINLKMSDNIDVNYIDNFIQELCKRIDAVETGGSKNFYKLIFTNVPRNLIRRLKKRNCASFLMLKETFCLILDETDKPHFLGIPRVTNGMFDVEEALILIYEKGCVSVADLLKLEMRPSAVEHLKALIGKSKDSIFSLQTSRGQEFFVAHDVEKALYKARLSSAEDLSNFSLSGSENIIFKLKNNAYVDRIYDFCLCWSNERVLTDCAKLMLSHGKVPLAETIVAFMNNGDRLASAIQRFIRTPKLVMVDPHDVSRWDHILVDGNCLIVIDALYPGDEDAGYIKNFVDHCSSMDGVKLKGIWAFHDFREKENDTVQSTNFGDLEVLSFPIPDATDIPIRVEPSLDDTILQNFQDYVLSKSLGKVESENNEPDLELFHYTPVELSTEFWQNLSAHSIIESKPTGREKRNVLFYENNERLIQSPRMRRVVTQFIADYVKNVLNSNVDVILHPSHSVGSFMAQYVASHLSRRPLIIPLQQKIYGGQIDLTTEDYGYFHSLIAKRQRKQPTTPLVSLIIDDSVLTGASLFMMLGISANLGLKNNGLLVLLSRLRPEISAGFSQLGTHFSHLYRLHMPILGRDQSPDRKLSILNEDENFKSTTGSYFGSLWSEILRTEKTHLHPEGEVIDPEVGPKANPQYIADIHGQFMETYALRQIIERLILHDDPKILDFDIRVAISYNFLDQLTKEESYWKFLLAVFKSPESIRPESQTTHFLRKTLFIIAFSRNIPSLPVSQEFQELCVQIITESFETGSWRQQERLVTDCLMWLGVIGSELLPKVALIVLKECMNWVFEDLCRLKPSDEWETLSRLGQIKEKQKAALHIIASFGWALYAYVSRKGQNLIDNESILDLVHTLINAQIPTERNLILIDILEPLIGSSLQLRERLGIQAWVRQDKFLDELNHENGDNPLMAYLKGAPGYACTLKTILRVCKADTVLVYAKNKDDKEFFLRVFDTSEGKRADDDLEAQSFTEKSLPGYVRERMKDSLFFSSTHEQIVEHLNNFSKGSKHVWCTGGAVDIGASAMHYYVILGYSKEKISPKLQSTGYYYWLKCKAILQKILPSIHSKYVESASEWNAQVQSIRPLHPIRADDSQRTVLVNSRRKLIGDAMTNIDVGDLLRRTVRMFSQPVYKLSSIRDDLGAVCTRLRFHLREVIGERRNQDLVQKAGEFKIPYFSPEMPALDRRQETTFCTLHMTLLTFIAYECLCNSLAYFDRRIVVKLRFLERTDKEPYRVMLSISNDVNPLAPSPYRTRKSRGILACQTAVGVVGGSFESQPDDISGDWIATTILPAHTVPDELRRNLHGLLK